MRPLLALVLPVLLVGCDSMRAGPGEDGPQGLGLDIAYEVTGTYDYCDVAYRGFDGRIKTVEGATLPFKRYFSITPERAFEARVAATCYAEGKLGKSTATIYVDHKEAFHASNVGYGETSEASLVVGGDDPGSDD